MHIHIWLRERIELEKYLLFITSEAFANDFAFKSSSFFDGKVLVVLSKTSLALLVHHQYKSDPHYYDPERKKEKLGFEILMFSGFWQLYFSSFYTSQLSLHSDFTNFKENIIYFFSYKAMNTIIFPFQCIPL